MRFRDLPHELYLDKLKAYGFRPAGMGEWRLPPPHDHLVVNERHGIRLRKPTRRKLLANLLRVWEREKGEP